jgi:hypothetical protein
MAETGRYGNDFDESIRAVVQGKTPAFDSTECETPASVLPSRRHCGVRIVGHGVETGGWMVCGDRGAEPPSGSS